MICKHFAINIFKQAWARFLQLNNLKYFYLIRIILFGLVLWYINPYRLFNAKSFLYIYIKYDWYFQTSLNSFFHTVKWFYWFLSYTNSQLNEKNSSLSYNSI